MGILFNKSSKSKIVCGHRIQDVIETLARVEPLIYDRMQDAFDCPHLTPPGINYYRRIEKWFISEKYLDRLLRGIPTHLSKPGGEIPAFLKKDPKKSRLWLIRNFAERYEIHSRAQAIRVQSNLRTFYLQNEIDTKWSCSAKIAMSGVRDVQHLRNEIQIREKLAQVGVTGLPRIYMSSLDTNPPFFCEEIISGRTLHHIKDSSIICERVVAQMGDLYRKYGMCFRPAKEIFDADSLTRYLNIVMQEIPWNPEWMEQSSFMSSAMALTVDERLVPWSIGHGDIGMSNIMLNSQNELYIIDWEMAYEMPIACDLLRLIRHIPFAQGILAVDRLLNDINWSSNKNKGQILLTEEQCAIAALHEMCRYIQHADYRKLWGYEKWKDKLLVQIQLINKFWEASRRTNYSP